MTPKRKEPENHDEGRLYDLLSRVEPSILMKFCGECGLTREESRELAEILRHIRK